MALLPGNYLLEPRYTKTTPSSFKPFSRWPWLERYPSQATPGLQPKSQRNGESASKRELERLTNGQVATQDISIGQISTNVYDAEVEADTTTHGRAPVSGGRIA